MALIWTLGLNTNLQVQKEKKNKRVTNMQKYSKKKALSSGDPAVPSRARCNERIVVLPRLPRSSWYMTQQGHKC